MQGRVLNKEMVLWVDHLLQDTAWVPDRQAAADLLATIQYLTDNSGELPGEAIVPPGLAVPKPLSAEGEVISSTPARKARAARPKNTPATQRPILTLVPPEPATKTESDSRGS